MHSLLERRTATNGSAFVEVLERRNIDNEVAVDAVLAAHAVTTMPTYEMYPQVGRMPDGNINRETITLPSGLGLSPYPTHTILGPGVKVEFLSQLNKDDAKLVELMLVAAKKMAEDQARVRRAKLSGLVLPGDAGATPPGKIHV